MDDKGSTTFVRIDARIAKSPRRNGNIGKNRQPFARQRTPCMLSEKRRSLSPVEREAERLSAGLLRLPASQEGVSRCFCVCTRAYTCTRTHTHEAPTRLLGNAPLLKRIPRAFPASRGAPFVDMQTMTRFPVPADSALPSRISSREERAGWIPPPQILPRPLRDAPVCTLVHFSSRPEYTSDRYRLRKEERSVLPTVLLMDAFRLSTATTG